MREHRAQGVLSAPRDEARAWRVRHLRARLGAPPAMARPEAAPGSLADLRGRLVEIDGGGAQGAALTVAAALVREVQGAGEPAAWIAAGPSVAYPPDLAAWGIDLGALPLVQAGSLGRALRAADLLLRSGAFGLLVLDEVGRGGAGLPLPVQTRLAGLALRHQAAVLFVTARDPGQASLGSLTSLRLGCRWERAGVHLSCRVRALKDKRRGPGWTTERPIDGLPGLR